jgi:hypothetical protein
MLFGQYLKRGLFEIRHADCDELFFPAELILLVDHTRNIMNIVQRNLNVLSNLLVFDFHQRFSHLKNFTNPPTCKSYLSILEQVVQLNNPIGALFNGAQIFNQHRQIFIIDVQIFFFVIIDFQMMTMVNL